MTCFKEMELDWQHFEKSQQQHRQAVFGVDSSWSLSQRKIKNTRRKTVKKGVERVKITWTETNKKGRDHVVWLPIVLAYSSIS